MMGGTYATIDALRQHQLVILRRLRGGPLTEFELIAELEEHTGFSHDQVTERLPGWLAELRDAGLLWCGVLSNANGQDMLAAALTRQGLELVR